MKIKILIACLSLFIPAIGFSEGEYIKDQKHNAMVWNNKPRSGDSVLWIGNMDSDGFASGFGMVVWGKYGDFQSAYFGTMKNGRLEGLVRSFDNRGNFAKGHWNDGKKSSDWHQIKDAYEARNAAEEIKRLFDDLNTEEVRKSNIDPEIGELLRKALE